MLILTRKLKEQIQIGDNIHITVLKISARTVQIGIDAPRDVRVKRTELKAEQTAPTASVESPPFAAIANRTSPALPSESCDALPHRLPADNSRSTSQFPTAVSDPARRPVLAIGRRYRVLAPTQEGSSMLRAIPLSE